MGKNKIADSIIIRVGGGIREVPREPLVTPDVIEPVNKEPDIKQPEEANSFPTEYGPTSKFSKDNSTIN